MGDSLNILILSCGTRNKIIQYFKKELGDKGQILATDCSSLAPALYDADKYFIVPRMDEEGYLDVILEICKENNVKGILSLIDPELSLLAQNKDKFLAVGVTPIVSDYNIIEMAFNKFKFNNFLIENGFNSIKSYVEKEFFIKDLEAGVIKFPVFVKPVKGSASINISKVSSIEEIDTLFEKYDNLMIQEFMDGVEYGVDVYIDMISGEPVTMFAKEKIKMRAGETDKSVSVKHTELFELINRFLDKMKFKGIIDIDIFKLEEKYYISEVNPRFGGGYPHAYECGVNVPRMIIKNLENISNQNLVGKYDENVYMMKFNDLKLIKI